jgi:hypothetical protein
MRGLRLIRPALGRVARCYFPGEDNISVPLCISLFSLIVAFLSFYSVISNLELGGYQKRVRGLDLNWLGG